MNRYRVEVSPDGLSVIIYDRRLMGQCALPLESPLNIRRLWWPFDGNIHSESAARAFEAAEEWLASCYQQWGKVPKVDEPHPADIDWEEVRAAGADPYAWQKEWVRRFDEIRARTK